MRARSVVDANDPARRLSGLVAFVSPDNFLVSNMTARSAQALMSIQAYGDAPPRQRHNWPTKRHDLVTPTVNTQEACRWRLGGATFRQNYLQAAARIRAAWRAKCRIPAGALDSGKFLRAS